MILLNILLLILLVILIVLAAIILIPYTYVINGDNIENKIKFCIIWLFGRLRITYAKNFNQRDELTIGIFNFSKKVLVNSSKEAGHKKAKKNKSEKKKNINWKDHINGAVVNKFFILLAKVLRLCRPRNILINAKIGFNNPMYTGLLYALYSQYSYVFIRDSIQFQPAFDEEVFKGRFSVSGTVWVLYLLIFILEFLFSSPVRNEIKLIIKKRGGVQYVR